MGTFGGKSAPRPAEADQAIALRIAGAGSGTAATDTLGGAFAVVAVGGTVASGAVSATAAGVEGGAADLSMTAAAADAGATRGSAARRTFGGALAIIAALGGAAEATERTALDDRMTPPLNLGVLCSLFLDVGTNSLLRDQDSLLASCVSLWRLRVEAVDGCIVDSFGPCLYAKMLAYTSRLWLGASAAGIVSVALAFGAWRSTSSLGLAGGAAASGTAAAARATGPADGAAACNTGSTSLDLGAAASAAGTLAGEARCTAGDLRRALATTDLLDQRLRQALVAKCPPFALLEAWMAWPRADDDEVVEVLRCYTDGSAKLARGRANSGFGFVLLAERRTPAGVSLAFVGVGFAPVIIAPMTEGHAGATHHSAPVAELSAACGVLLAVSTIVVQLPKIVFFIDSTYAIDILLGRSRARSNAALVFRARQAMYEVSARTLVLAFHIKGHSGDPGNELADIAADAGLAADAATAGRLFGTTAARLALPRLALADLIFWQQIADAPDPAAPRAPCVLERDLGLADEPRQADQDLCELCITVCSANVFSLKQCDAPDAEGVIEFTGTSARRRDLALQFAAAGYDIVGVQEARSSPVAEGHVGDFVYWASGAAAGQGGVELWLRRRLHARALGVFILHADHRRLIARILFPSGAFLVVVGHALTSQASTDDIAAWWATTSQLVVFHTRPRDAVISLIDANGRVGDVLSPAVGAVAPDQQDLNGVGLHEYLAAIE